MGIAWLLRNVYLRDQRFEAAIFAGKEYAEPIRKALLMERVKVDEPMRGLQVGERLHWLKERLQLNLFPEAQHGEGL